MKYLIFLITILFSQVVYGQQQNRDLIVTTTGDSLFCKIIDVNPNEIQFSFDRSGSVITIKRSETVSHTYNYRPASVSGKSSDKRNTEKSAGFFNVAISAGVNTFGTISVGDVESGGAFVFGGDFGYFYNPYFGAGIKFFVTSCDINFSDYFWGSDRLSFGGPALYGRFGKKKLSYGVSASFGYLTWLLSNASINNVKLDDVSATNFGGFVSAGVNYMVTQEIGLGFNIQSMFGSIKTDNYERTSAPAGFVLEVNYRF